MNYEDFCRSKSIDNKIKTLENISLKDFLEDEEMQETVLGFLTEDTLKEKGENNVER